MLKSRVKDSDLRYFLAVSSAGSFSRAADSLGVSGSALSQRISALERTMSKDLFHRDGRGVCLTKHGEELRSLVAPLYRDLNNAITQFTGDDRTATTRLSIATVQTVISYFLGPAMVAFSRERAGARFELLAGPTQDTVGLIKTGRADIGIGYGEDVASSDLDLQYLFSEQYCFVETNDLAANGIDPGRSARFPDVPMILPPARYGLRMLVERKFGAVDVACEVYSFDEIISLTKQGLGVGIVPMYVAREQADHLRIVEGLSTDLSRQIMLMSYRGRKMSDSAVSFIDMLKYRSTEMGAQGR